MLDEAMSGSSSLLTPEQFAHLGDGALAYMKPIRSEDVWQLFPDAPAMQPGLQLFALLAADGTPLVVTNSRDAALANALENELLMVSVH
jgi:hypothetical protein